MPRIILETRINAPIERVFDLARSIDLHLVAFKETNEKAIAGRKTGLINENEFVTWRARHLWFKRKLTSAITYMSGPFVFVDKMVKGPFKKLEHQHYFDCSDNDKTVMKDVFEYKSPLGVFGKLLDKLFLKRYLERLLIKRNHIIKNYAENDEKWMQILNIY